MITYELDTQYKLSLEQGVDEYDGQTVLRGPYCHHGGITGYGNTSSKVMFIGISPAKDEMSRSKRPLTGQSGKLLNATLKAIGQKREDYYCTNLICWWKDDPNKDEAAKCATRLKAEIKAVKPKLIVLLGKIVAETFIDKPFGKSRGAVLWSDEYGCYIMATYHPAAILRSIGDYGSSKDDKATNFIHNFVRDLRKIPEVVIWEPKAPLAKVDYTIVKTPKFAQEILNYLSRLSILYPGKPIALDVETTYDKDDEETEVFEDVELLCVGVGHSQHCWVFTPSALFDEEGTPLLKWPDNIHWTMQNGIFDVQIVRRLLGQWITIHEDTMLQSYSLDERGGIHGLKPQAREYLGAGFYEEDRGKGKKNLKSHHDMHGAELEEFWRKLFEYNAKDVVYTARLCERYIPLQIEDDVRDFYLELLIPGLNMYKEIQFRGAAIDHNLHKEFALTWGNKIIEDETQLWKDAEEAGWDGLLNISAPAQLAKFLFNILSLPVIKRTKKGAISVDKDVLEALEDQHPFVKRLQDLRRLYKMFGVYITNLRSHLKQDGRAHSVVSLHRTRTGRPAYQKPPLQTIPVPYQNQLSFGRLRELFVASPINFVRMFCRAYNLPEPPPDEEEYLIIESDYGKAEIWMAYAYSGDPQMYSDLTSGDYHTTVAMDVMKKQRDEITGKDRLDMKRVTFGIMYDREAPSLSKAIDSTVQRAQAYINGFFRRNAKYAEWFKSIQKQIKAAGEIVSKTGRKRRIIILGNSNRALKQAVNFPIQSTASDMLLLSAIDLHPLLQKIASFILFTVHDSIVSEAPKSKIPEAVQMIHDTMTKKRYDDIPSIPVEIKVGPSWGKCKAVHECGGKCLMPNHERGCQCGLDAFGRSQRCLW